MNFTINGRIVAELTEVRLRAASPGLGFYQLFFECQFAFFDASAPAGVAMFDVNGGYVLASRPGQARGEALGPLSVWSGSPRAQSVGRNSPIKLTSSLSYRPNESQL
jgi:hypothetical protein